MVRSKRRTTKRNIMTTAIASKRKAAGACASSRESSVLKAEAYLTEAEKQMIKNLDHAIKRVTSSKQAATDFLKRAGIMDSSGDLAKAYRND